MTQLGRFLEQRRAQLGLSRREVAELAQLSYPYVSQLETGERQPALKAMRALAPVLQVRVEELATLVAGSGEWSTPTFDALDDNVAGHTGAGSLRPGSRTGNTGTHRVLATNLRAGDVRTPNVPAEAQAGGLHREKTLLSLERRLRDVPPLERLAILSRLIDLAVADLAAERDRD